MCIRDRRGTVPSWHVLGGTTPALLRHCEPLVPPRAAAAAPRPLAPRPWGGFASHVHRPTHSWAGGCASPYCALRAEGHEGSNPLPQHAIHPMHPTWPRGSRVRGVTPVSRLPFSRLTPRGIRCLGEGRPYQWGRATFAMLRGCWLRVWGSPLRGGAGTWAHRSRASRFEGRVRRGLPRCVA